MSANQKPLKRSILIGCSVFLVLLCLILSILTYISYTNSLYHAYEERMIDIINYVESHIDVDDLSECISTGVESPKYKELMAFMDGIMEDFDIHYLYISNPYLEGDKFGMLNILSADTALGRETDPDGFYINFDMVGDYELKDIKLYMAAMEKDGITCFKNFSKWGYDYTASKTLYDSKGKRLGVLCVDIEVSEVENTIKAYTIANVALIVFLGIFFISIFFMWMTRNITDPISKLEKSVVAFARKSHEQKDPDQLCYDDPHINTHNEVESLSNAVSQMSTDMRDYVKNILDAEGAVADMKTQVMQMDQVAYQDALTHVKNKAWYDKTEGRVNQEISEGKARFGLLMTDLNNLKKINDTYGHDHGNEYISGACHQICITYQHSPVFRIGGDEFVVLLEKSDYDNRDELLAKLKAIFKEASSDAWKEPWEKYSCAFGMAVFDPQKDKCMEDVFKRADSLMYKDKQASKLARQ